MPKIIKSTLLARTRWLNLFEVAYRDHDHKDRTWQLASRHQQPKCMNPEPDIPDGVLIVPFHVERKRLVIIREFRVPLADVEYGFPAGLVDSGESVVSTARRELLEETGLELTTVLEIGPPLYSSAGMTDESVVPVYAECRGTPSSEGNTSGERIEVDFLSPGQALGLCRDPHKKFDAKAWLILKSFSESGKICGRAGD